MVRMTAGSSGDPAIVLVDALTNAYSLAARIRFFETHGIKDGDRELRLWGRPLTSSKWKILGKSTVLNRILVDAASMNEDSRRHTIQRVRRFAPDYLYGYTSLVDMFSHLEGVDALVEAGWRPKAAVCTSETSTRFERDAIGRRLACPVLNEYGCSETDIIAAECPVGSMHVIEENVYVEVLDEEGKPASSGDIVVTDLNNTFMPLIRYRIGDTGTVDSNACACGRGAMVIASIDGRVQGQFLVARDGSRFHAQTIAYLFEELVNAGIPIRRFKAVQTEQDQLVLYVVATELNERERVSVAERVAVETGALTGGRFEVTVEFVHVEELVPRNGKYRHFENWVTSHSE